MEFKAENGSITFNNVEIARFWINGSRKKRNELAKNCAKFLTLLEKEEK